MKVSELKKQLDQFDDELDVFLVDLEDDSESGTKVLKDVLQDEVVSQFDDEETKPALIITF